MVFTSLSEPFILQLKFIIFSGLTGIAVVIGTEYRKKTNRLLRLLSIILPTSAIAFYHVPLVSG
jgi:hypothetical protein